MSALLEALARRGISGDHLADTLVGVIREASRGDEPGSFSRIDVGALRSEWLPRVLKAYETGAIARLGAQRVAEIILSTEPPSDQVPE